MIYPGGSCIIWGAGRCGALSDMADFMLGLLNLFEVLENMNDWGVCHNADVDCDGFNPTTKHNHKQCQSF